MHQLTRSPARRTTYYYTWRVSIRRHRSVHKHARIINKIAICLRIPQFCSLLKHQHFSKWIHKKKKIEIGTHVTDPIFIPNVYVTVTRIMIYVSATIPNIAFKKRTYHNCSHMNTMRQKYFHY